MSPSGSNSPSKSLMSGNSQHLPLRWRQQFLSRTTLICRLTWYSPSRAFRLRRRKLLEVLSPPKSKELLFTRILLKNIMHLMSRSLLSRRSNGSLPGAVSIDLSLLSLATWRSTCSLTGSAWSRWTRATSIKSRPIDSRPSFLRRKSQLYKRGSTLISKEVKTRLSRWRSGRGPHLRLNQSTGVLKMGSSASWTRRRSSLHLCLVIT